MKTKNKIRNLIKKYNELDKNGPLRDDPGYWELEVQLRKIQKEIKVLAKRS